jgi:hypothetical protein
MPSAAASRRKAKGKRQNAPPADKNFPKLRTEYPAVDPQTTPAALERHFGRDTLLYFPWSEGRPRPWRCRQSSTAPS